MAQGVESEATQGHCYHRGLDSHEDLLFYENKPTKYNWSDYYLQ